MDVNSYTMAHRWLIQGMNRERDFFILNCDQQWLKTQASDQYGHHLRTSQTTTPAIIIDVPKDNGEYRPAPYVTPADRLRLTANIANCFDTMLKHVPALRIYDLDYATTLPMNSNDVEWIGNWRDSQNRFRTRTKLAIDEGKYVAFTDIQSFASSCDLDMLGFILSKCHCNSDSVTEIKNICTELLANSRTGGVPQGLIATDILLKVMLAPVDVVMRNNRNIRFFRNNDDFRIIADTEEALEGGLEMLERITKQIGLQLHPHKRKIFRPDEDHQPLNEIDRAYQAFLPADPTQPLGVEPIPVLKLEYVYRDSIAPWATQSACQSLFNFTLNRLGKAFSTVAHCDLQELIELYPGRQNVIIKYGLATNYDKFEQLMDRLPDRSKPYFAYALCYEAGSQAQKGRRNITQSTLSLIRQLASTSSGQSWIIQQAAKEALISLFPRETHFDFERIMPN